jgi:hypothetical protein
MIENSEYNFLFLFFRCLSMNLMQPYNNTGQQPQRKIRTKKESPWQILIDAALPPQASQRGGPQPCESVGTFRKGEAAERGRQETSEGGGRGGSVFGFGSVWTKEEKVGLMGGVVGLFFFFSYSFCSFVLFVDGETENVWVSHIYILRCDTFK